MKNAKLHPMLEAGLNSLDLDLESELNRFRQSKNGALNGGSLNGLLQSSGGATSSLPTYENSARPNSKVTATARSAIQDIPISAVDEVFSFEEAWLDPDAVLMDQSSDQLSDQTSDQVSDQTQSPPGRAQPTPPAAMKLPPLDLAAILQVNTTPKDTLPPSPPQSSSQTSFNWPENLSMPEDYLASTEALLNSLADGPDAPTRLQSPAQTPSLPLVISLGLTSLILGGGITTLFFTTRPTTQPQKPTVLPVASASPTPTSTALPIAANLAQVEFQNLNQTSLGILPASSPAPSLVPSQPPNSTPAAPVAAMVRVVIPNGDAQMLGQVQKLVPGAVLVSTTEGSKIQLGVFKDVSRANALITNLRQQGFTAQTEQP